MVEQKQVDVAKELDDVMVLLVGIVQDLKAKKPIADVASGRLGDLMSALNGMDQVDDELKQNRKVALATAGSRLGELIDALLPSA